jgi:signal transduction histidine kinase
LFTTTHNDPVTVRREVLKSAALSVAAVVVVTAGGFWAARNAAVDEALHQAEQATELVASSIIVPALDDALLAGDPAAIDALDESVQRFVIGERIFTVRIWSAKGRILYSDDLTNIGSVFPLGEDETAVLQTQQPHSELSDLAKEENLDQSDFDQLLEVYVPVEAQNGETLLFETYQSTDGLTAGTSRILASFMPVILGGLLVFGAIQLLLAWRLARNLERTQEERELLMQKSLDASEHERHTIAADLHDGVVQDLVGLTFALDGLAAGTPPDTSRALTAAAATTRRSVRSLRSLIVEIYPPNLSEVGLEGAVADLVAAAGSSGVEVSVDLDPRVELTPAARAAAYRTVRESLSNVAKHAQANHVLIKLHPDGSSVAKGEPAGSVLTITDDGVGFDPAEVRTGHFGLRLLHDVADSVGANLEVSSESGLGTTVRMEIPS